MFTLMRALPALFLTAILALLWIAPGCQRTDASDATFRAVVTIAPLKGLVEPLLPEGAEVYIVIPPGRSEHGYEFTPADVSALSKADLVVYVGMGLEPRIERFLSLNPTESRQTVSFAQAVGLEEEGAHHHHHDHEHSEYCDHGDDDPHLWVDPVLCAQLVPALRQAIERSLHHKGTLTEEELTRLAQAEAQLIADINAFHAWAGETLAPHEGKAIVTHHGAWGRLTDRYGLRVAAVLRPVETAETTPGAMAAMMEAIRKENVKALFIEPQFSAGAAERIAAAANLEIGMIDPLGQGDWFATMRRNIETIAEKLDAPAS